MSEYEEEVKESGAQFAVAMIDIDHFKKINDTYGHDVGDKIIIALSEILRTSTSHMDVVARFGGEEFCVVLKNINRYSAKDIFERIRVEIENFSFHIGREVYIKFTVSIGLVMNSEEPLEEIISQADMMLYNAKNDGRNKLVFE
jgi:diguanylate cyclase (GGDEF)-like protein